MLEHIKIKEVCENVDLASLQVYRPDPFTIIMILKLIFEGNKVA